MRSGDRRGALRRLNRAGDPSFRDHRRNVLQPGDRRPWQGTSGARDRRAGWRDGARRRQGRHPVSRPQPPQGSGCPGTPRPGRPEALSARDAGPGRRDPESHRRRRRSGAHPVRGGRGHRSRARRRPLNRLPGRRPDHRHVPSRSHPSRRPAHPGRALRRSSPRCRWRAVSTRPGSPLRGSRPGPRLASTARPSTGSVSRFRTAIPSPNSSPR